MEEKEKQSPAVDPAQSNEKAPNKPQPNLNEPREGSFRDADDQSDGSEPSTSSSSKFQIKKD